MHCPVEARHCLGTKEKFGIQTVQTHEAPPTCWTVFINIYTIIISSELRLHQYLLFRTEPFKTSPKQTQAKKYVCKILNSSEIQRKI